MPLYRLDDTHRFPSASKALPGGLLAVGGDLSPERLLKAYAQGIFPWSNPGEPLLWWSPDPRMMLSPHEAYVSKSMRKLLRDNIFEIRFDTNFMEVVNSCATVKRRDFHGTWITKALAESFGRLHDMGLAHSIEAWQQGKLVGGLYGLALGGCFFGESMFHHVSNASKAAFIALAQFLQKHGFLLIDAQQQTAHLASLGAYPRSRHEFLELLNQALLLPTLVGKWDTPNQHFVNLSLL